MSYLPVILSLAGTVIQAVGQVRERAQKSEAELYNAQVAQAQAQAQATSTAFETETLKKQSAIEQAQITREKTKTISAQRAAYAKAGVRLDEGSPIEVMSDTAAQFELDLAANRYNLASGLETLRFGSETEIAKLKSEQEYRKKLAGSYTKSGYLSGAGTLLTGLYGAKSNWPVKATTKAG